MVCPSPDAPDLRVRELERRLLQVAVGLVDIPANRIDDSIREALETVGAHTDVDRISVFTYDWDAGTATVRQEWCAPGISAVFDDGEVVSIDRWPAEAQRHRRGGSSFVADTHQLPAGPFRDLLLATGTRSLLDIPLMRATSCLGFVAFETVGRTTGWSDDHRELLRVLADLLRNVEQRTQYEVARRRVVDLTAANEELERFAGVVAHDLKAPLTTVAGMIETVASGRVPPDQAADLLRRGMAGVDRMGRLIDQLLAYAAAGRVIGEPTVVAMDAVAADAIDRCAKLMTDHGATVHVGPLPMVLGDADRLVEVVQNLVANAVLHAPAGHDATVWIEAARIDGDVEVVVHDDGAGIAPEYRGRVLRLFEHARPAGRGRGTGLGLPIVASIVEAHGGTLTMGSGPAGGLAVTLRLPAPRADS